MPITRRILLGLLSSSSFFLSAARYAGAAAALGADAPALSFPQGVASGDPRPAGVMLWTRALPAAGTAGADAAGKVPLLLQLSRSDDFSQPLLQVPLSTDAASDYTVRAYLDGLEPDTTYYYRFLGGRFLGGRFPGGRLPGDARPGEAPVTGTLPEGAGSSSRVGQTRTAPAPGQERDVKFAFVSCQNYEDAYYGAWARLLADDAAAPADERIQFVLHLGDFIYERCWNTRPDGSALSRRVPPFPDGVTTEDNRYAVSLADYRHLYRTYLADPELQAARARWPFICTWDDHEFANNNFQSYNTYGEVPQLQARRKASANQAWFEYIPAVLDELVDQPAHDFRPVAGDTPGNDEARDSLCIYRALRWGRNLDLVLTDSRSYRSAPCLPDTLAGELGLPLNSVRLVEIADAGAAYADGNPPAFLPYGDGTIANPARTREPGTLLGPTQRDWLLATLEGSGARWKIWGNALPLLPLRLDLSALPLAGYEDSIFTIDAWSGYPHELAYLMRELAQRQVSGCVSLSGDHHMHGAGTIRRSTTAADAAPVMVDFNVAGISSSPLFDELSVVAARDHPAFQPIVMAEEDGRIVPVWNMTMVDGVFAALTYAKTGLASLARWLGPNHANPGLAYVDTTANGYGLATLTPAEMRVQLVTITGSRQPFSEAPAVAHIASFRLPAWHSGEPPVLQGPAFELGAPFPFQLTTV